MSRASNKLPEVRKTEVAEVEDEVKSRRVIQKMTPKAWDILFLHVTDNKLTQTEIAERVDSQQPYVNRVMNSPCFLKELNNIRRERIHDRLNGAMFDGIDRMERIFNDDESSDANAIAAFKAVSDASGMSGKGAPGGGDGGGGSQTVNLGVTVEMIQEANKRRHAKLFDGNTGEVVDDQDE